VYFQSDINLIALFKATFEDVQLSCVLQVELLWRLKQKLIVMM